MDTHKKPPVRLKHYTKLPALINILETGELMLNGPESWDEKNDFAALEAFRRVSGAGKVRVVCFAEGNEMIHQWFYHAQKGGGGCIQFKTEKLLDVLEKTENRYLHGSVKYLPKKDLLASNLSRINPEEIPFIKRRPFECEKEYRVIWTGKEAEEAPPIPVKGLIDHITLSPGFSESSQTALKKMLEERYDITVQFSRMLEDSDWMSRFQNMKK